uniref:Uncharacterized protein n=1 Tax=Timema shepardi TaxID=629360 RepID=A0A7R9G4I1_TIMSH|nr:unnamed protein product [Timema shepardi]
MCKTQMSCIPTNSRDIMVPVRRRDKNSGELTCGHITVEEHTRCGCRCTLMAKHCSSIQVCGSLSPSDTGITKFYIEDRLLEFIGAVSRDEVKLNTTSALANYTTETYDANMCKCLCMDKKLMPKCVAEGKKWVEDDCSCVCREVKNCSNGEIWDNVKCR